MKQILDIFQEIVDEKLSMKTNWGTSQIKMVMLEAKNEVLMEILDGKLKKP